MYKHSSVVSKLPRKILYRKGDLDAFLAAYVYWVYFGTVTGQEYISIDPMDDEFKKQLHAPFHLGEIETNYEHEYIISIGANVEKVSYTRDSTLSKTPRRSTIVAVTSIRSSTWIMSKACSEYSVRN